MPLRMSLAKMLTRAAGAIAGPARRAQLGAVSARVGDGPRGLNGWSPISAREHERSWSEIKELYDDTLEAWRRNPLAKRATDITADYVVGDGITLASPQPALQAYIDAFWNHRKNLVGNRLEPMSNELALAGDLFPVLFLTPHDGLSYIRFVVKDAIREIHPAENDWELEIAY
ncbi:MAG: hypothetical protein R3272_14760, partial [Candidatus Promineifilaceae bacterium]|nr:hypothetical protein [Candidatus Promineifilaceae bacterium]